MAENGRYWLFFGDEYYPGGGMEDFLAASDSIDELRARSEMGDEDCWEKDFDPRNHWWHIVDTKTADIVDRHYPWEPNDEMQKRIDILDDADRVKRASQPKPKISGNTGGEDKASLSPVYDKAKE